MIITKDLKFQEQLKLWANYLAACILLIALLTIAGWQFSIDAIIHPMPHLPPMNPATAVTFILFSCSFFLLTGKNHLPHQEKMGKMLAYAVLIVGAIKLLSRIFSFDPRIDSFLYHDKIFAKTPIPFFAYMSPVAAYCFIFSGLSLLMMKNEITGNRSPAQYMSLLVTTAGFFSFLAYIFTVRAFYGDYTYVTMAIHTAICFMFTGLCILFAAADKGMMREITTPFLGSIVARRLIPIAALIPVIFGLIRLYLELHGNVNYELGITLLIMCFVVVLLSFIFYTIKLLNKRDLETREAEDEITETNYFLNTLLENIPNMIFVKDARELRFFRLNKAGEKLLGYSRNDLIGKNDYDFFPKEQADFFTMKDREVLDSNLMLDIEEEPIITKHGERWLHTKKIPVRDENGNPLYLVGISEDITERRKLDAQLKQLNAELEKNVQISKANEEMFSSLFYKSPVMKAITETGTGRYLDVNDSFARFMELEKEDMIGKTSIELDILVYPEQREYILKKLWKEGFVRDVETMVKYKNGKTRWISSNTDKISLNGVECYLTASLDITERKLAEQKLLQLSQELEGKVEERTMDLRNSEAKFRLLIENSDEAILMVDRNFVPIYRSPSTERITGWNTEERMKLQSGVDLTHPDDVEKVKKSMVDALASPGIPVQVAFRTKHKNGHYIWVAGQLTNLLDDDVLKAIVLNFHDVTETKKAEEEIYKLTEELRELLEHMETSREQERKHIAREIHDELGQRLTALKIDVSMMRKKIPGGAGQEYFTQEISSILSQIDQSIEWVKRIATDLRPEILDHYGIIAAVKWQAHKFETSTGIKCKVSHLPDELTLEPDQAAAVYRTVQEALTNITRHAQATLATILIEQDAEQLLIQIKDNGIGINEEQIKSIKSLGLIGIRERVHLLKGTFSISRQPEGGTSVSAIIPIVRNNQI